MCELWNFIDLTLKLKLHPDIVKMYVYTKIEAPAFNGSKDIAWTHRLTERLDWNYYLPAYAVCNKIRKHSLCRFLPDKYTFPNKTFANVNISGASNARVPAIHNEI